MGSKDFALSRSRRPIGLFAPDMTAVVGGGWGLELECRRRCCATVVLWNQLKCCGGDIDDLGSFGDL